MEHSEYLSLIILGKGKGIKLKIGKVGPGGKVPYFYTDGKMTLDSELATNEKSRAASSESNVILPSV